MIKKIISLFLFFSFFFNNLYAYNKNLEYKIYNNLLKINNIKKLKDFGNNKYEISKNLIKFIEKEIDVNFKYNKEIYNSLTDKDMILLIILSIIKTESNFNPKAIGDKGRSYGLMQINLETLKYVLPKYYKKHKNNIKNILKKPKYNISIGIYILKHKVDYFYKNLYNKLDIKKYKELIIKKLNIENKKIFIRYFPFISLYNGKILNTKYTKKIIKNFYYFLK